MTHTLNRRGLSEERPGEEIVFLCMIPADQRGKKSEEMLEMANTVLKYRPDNIIGAPVGLDEEGVRTLAKRGTIITAVFTNKDDVQKLVEEIKSKRLGISVVLSGLFQDVHEVCDKAGLKGHTHNISLGIFGKTERLPGEETLEITTQCGHALISPHYVKQIVRKIRKGKMTSEEGASLLIKPCVCGIGNPQRIKKSLDSMAN
jgi:hypothetical protein